jgi:hypothetical protein
MVAIWQRFRAVGETIILLYVDVTGLDGNTRLLDFVRPVVFHKAENVTQNLGN